jgi:predicted Zn-dependent protease
MHWNYADEEVMKLRRLALALILIVPLLHGCSVNPVTGQSDFVLMSEADEVALGYKENPNILKQYGQYSNEALQAYVNEVGQRLARKSHRSNLQYHFTLLDSTEVNAFALPGGYVYITRGLLAYLNNEAELAAVLGHEIGHVTARHSVRQLSAATAKDLGYSITSIFVPELQNEGVRQLYDVMGTALIRGYGREHELEADRLGAEYLARTGYDPQAMIGVIRVLKNQELFERQLAKEEQREPRVYHGVFATHPDNDERLKQVVKAAEKLKDRPVSRHVSREAFLQHEQGMVYGPSASQGILHGNRFYHRDLNISLSFPPAWDVDNQSERLIALAPGEAAVLQLTTEKAKAGESAVTWLQQKVPALEQRENISIADVHGATGRAKIKTAFGVREARIAALDHAGQRYLFIGVTQKQGALPKYEDAMLRSIRSLHTLRKNERILAEPHRIELHRLLRGETLEALARRSALGRHAEEQIRLLNDYYPSGEPQPGTLLKTVE